MYHLLTLKLHSVFRHLTRKSCVRAEGCREKAAPQSSHNGPSPPSAALQQLGFPWSQGTNWLRLLPLVR